ncbi:MAG: hypothetical protein NT175_05835 [Bacteroidetes bacterium]|nr:hypothetical protein [Bacteroidota bacterium]
MKKILLFLSGMLICITNSYSQAEFNTGALIVSINQYGSIELYTSDGTYQLDRTSILVGTSPTTVFDYKNDAEEFEPTVIVTNPTMSDYEIYGAYDNTYSGLPPDVIVKLNAYGWNNGGYIIAKFNIMNNEETAMNASAGLDIIPYLDEVYGYDTVTYNSAEEVIRFNRGAGVNMGMKLLSASLSSLYSFEWYDEYYVDTDYWNWMNTGSLQPFHATTSGEGTVTITSQNPVAINPGASFDVYYALALGIDEQTMLSNIAAAEQKYQSWFISVEDISPYTNEFNLRQNYPNPFNHSTTISYQLPCNGFVSLKIYDAIGNEAASLVNSEQAGGSHIIYYDATPLTNSVYYYTLRFNDQVKSNKMFLIK